MSAGITPGQNRKLHALVNNLGLDDQRYRNGLEKVAGVRSSKDLDEGGAAVVISLLTAAWERRKAEAEVAS